MELSTIILRRQAELSKLLAGCAAIDPAGVIPLIDQLSVEHLQDENARNFLSDLVKNYPNLLEAKEGQRAELIVLMAFQLGLAIEYLKWLELATEEAGIAIDKTITAIKEIKSLVITHSTLENLEGYAAHIESLYV